MENSNPGDSEAIVVEEPATLDSIQSLEAKIEEEIGKRPRSATLLTLKWLAERVRMTNQVETKIKTGNYSVDNEKIAKALLKGEDE